MPAVKDILLLGATGWLGSQVAHAILDKKAFNLKVLVRKETLEKKKDQIQSLKSKGAVVVEGSSKDLAALTSAAKGSDTIISLLGSQAIMEGDEDQLVAAAKASGTVKHIVPSQFGLDVDDLPDPGMLANKANRIKEIVNAGLTYTIITNGLFIELLFTKFFGIDQEAGTIFVFGDGNSKLSVTATADIAKFVPEILLDPNTVNKTVHLAGDTITYHQLIAIYEQVTGKKLTANYNDETALTKQIETFPPEAKFVPWLQLSGIKTKASNFEGRSDNWKYPNVVTVSVKEFIQKTFKN